MQSSRSSLPIEGIIHISLGRRIRTIEGIAIVLVQLQTLGQPLRQVWVRNEPAPKDDEVSIARLDFGRRVVPVESTGGDELDAALLQDLAELDERIALAGLRGGFGFDAFGAPGGVGGESVQFGLLVENFVEAWFDPVMT